VRKFSTQGFTLIELLIVVFIIAVLFGLAYPSYQSHLIKVRRIDGQKALLNLAASMEKSVLLSNSGYQTISFTTLSPGGYYKLSVAVADPQHFIATATPLKSQTADKTCGTLAINEQGAKGRIQNGSIVVDNNCW